MSIQRDEHETVLSDSILSSFACFPQVVWLGSTVEKARRDLDAGSFQSDLLLLLQSILFIIQEFL